jgi:hypothetical protein
MFNIFKGKDYVKFLVYLKGGNCVVFYKSLPKDKQPTVFMNELTDLLLRAKTDKETIDIITENYKENRGTITEYQSRVVIDGNDISAINSGMVE